MLLIQNFKKGKKISCIVKPYEAEAKIWKADMHIFTSLNIQRGVKKTRLTESLLLVPVDLHFNTTQFLFP